MNDYEIPTKWDDDFKWSVGKIDEPTGDEPDDESDDEAGDESDDESGDISGDISGDVSGDVSGGEPIEEGMKNMTIK